jgi:hypothetical protein
MASMSTSPNTLATRRRLTVWICFLFPFHVLDVQLGNTIRIVRGNGTFPNIRLLQSGPRPSCPSIII